MAAGTEVVAEKRKSLQPGAVIRCKTSLGEQFEGEVLGCDEEAKAVVIKSIDTTGSSKSMCDVTIINLALLDQSNFELISPPKNEPPPLPDVDKEKISKRLKSAKDRVGIGVSPQAQNLFDFIRKTIPECYWDKQDIFVLEEVTISPPYKAENCVGKKSTSVEYIKNIVSKFHNDHNPSLSSSSSSATSSSNHVSTDSNAIVT